MKLSIKNWRKFPELKDMCFHMERCLQVLSAMNENGPVSRTPLWNIRPLGTKRPYRFQSGTEIAYKAPEIRMPLDFSRTTLKENNFQLQFFIAIVKLLLHLLHARHCSKGFSYILYPAKWVRTEAEWRYLQARKVSKVSSPTLPFPRNYWCRSSTKRLE